MIYLSTYRQSNFQELCEEEDGVLTHNIEQYDDLLYKIDLLDHKVKEQQAEIDAQFRNSDKIANRGTHRYKALAWGLGIIFGLSASMWWVIIAHISN
jgi:sensor c-di-GMP phosphodiesterase-like protein